MILKSDIIKKSRDDVKKYLFWNIHQLSLFLEICNSVSI